MKNNTGIDDSVIEGFGEFLEIGLAASSDVFSKLLNTDVEIKLSHVDTESAGEISSFGSEPGVAVSLNITGAIYGRAVVMLNKEYAKSILSILMNTNNEISVDNEIDEMAMGTFKELIGHMSSAFAEAATNFFGSNLNIETIDILDLSSDLSEIPEIFGESADSEVYSIISEFNIADHFGGTFNVEVNKSTFDFTQNRLNMNPGVDPESLYMNAVGSGMDPSALAASSGMRRTGRPASVMKNSINVQSVQFPSFSNQMNGNGVSLLNGNMDLLMDVPLNVTIEIGKTRKKMRDIMEFAQGTVIDLEKQAGAPVDIVVNGQLIARGDVVVIDDNFGVRITEIVGNNSFIRK